MLIVDFMLKSPASFRTVVDRGEECASICALIFLSGHQKVKGMADRPDRKLHVRGQLAFHGPYIRPSAKTYDKRLVSAAHAAALKAVGKLIGLDKQTLFPMSLLGAGLEKGADEFLLIETIGQAGAWSIDLYGYRKPTMFTLTALTQACTNYNSWSVFEESPFSPMPDIEADDPPKIVRFEGKKFRHVLDGYGGEGTYNCFVDAIDAGPKGLFFKVQIGSKNDAEVKQASTNLQKEALGGPATPTGPGTPLFYVYGPSTKLSEISID
jgi:hypothetical protein